jgi:glycosyltransferase involved in cell wall biosynthesis
MSIEISVAICTYNRADLLSGVLESVCTQTLAPDRYEIIVVDNASTDKTAEVVLVYETKYPAHHLRRIIEPRQGTGYARNAVLKEAAGDYIAYLDDDAKAKPDWLVLACTHLDGPKLPDCLGGQIQPFYTTEKPSWFKDQYESRTWGEVTRYLEPDESFSGSNMVWRKETLLTIGGFAETMGPKGMNFSLGEDTMAFRRLWRAQIDPVVIYDPAMIVYHWVPAYKMRTTYVLKRAFMTGQAAIQLDKKPGIFWRGRTWFRSGGAVGIRMVRAAVRLPHYRRWQNWLIEECVPAASKLGTCLAACGIRFTIKHK